MLHYLKNIYKPVEQPYFFKFSRNSLSNGIHFQNNCKLFKHELYEWYYKIKHIYSFLRDIFWTFSKMLKKILHKIYNLILGTN